MSNILERTKANTPANEARIRGMEKYADSKYLYSRKIMLQSEFDYMISELKESLDDLECMKYAIKRTIDFLNEGGYPLYDVLTDVIDDEDEVKKIYDKIIVTTEE